MSKNPWEGLSREEALSKIQTLIRIYILFLRSKKGDMDSYSAKIADLRELHAEILEGKRETQFPSK